MGHGCPGLRWFQLAVLQQFDRDIVRRANKGHVSIAGRAIDRDAGIHQSLTGFVDILDLVSEMPEVATAGIFLRIPVISELDLRILVTGRSKEDERDASFRVLRRSAERRVGKEGVRTCRPRWSTDY